MADCVTEPTVESVAAQRFSLLIEIYGIVGESPVGTSAVLARFPSPRRRGRPPPSRDAVRSALVRLARAGLVVQTCASNTRAAELRFHREGTALGADEIAARLWPPRAPRPKQQSGGVCPQVFMIVGKWHRDRQGNLTRTIRGVAASEETIEPMRAAGRAGGMASARAREATKPAKPVLSSPASIGSP
jgi:hypothetical protein